MDGGRACNNLPVAADMCCWYDLVNKSTLVKHEHGPLTGSGRDEPRNLHTLKEIIALKAPGGLALGGILGAAGLAGLAGFAGAELGGFLGGNCFDQNLEIAVPPATILLNARFIGSAVACQARCFITLNCVNFNFDVLANV